MPSSEPTTIVPMPLSLLDEHVHYARVRTLGDEPPPKPGMLDVAVLDMNHGYPNLGHASIVETLQTVHLEGDPLETVLLNIRHSYLDAAGDVVLVQPGDR